MDRDSSRVFISSSFSDLVDVRAELEAHVRELGLRPIVSESPDSEFNATTQQGTIETCLVNVRASGTLLCILDRCYGARFTVYGDISATHAEYREARRVKIPVHLYVRDRLEGEYEAFKNDRAAGGAAWTSPPISLRGRFQAALWSLPGSRSPARALARA